MGLRRRRMEPQASQPTWWDLHLRKARGEVLSESEQALYDAEIARHDQEMPLRGNLEALKALRDTVMTLAQENANLRKRLAQLETEREAVERGLNQPTREFLGVPE